MTMNEFDGIKNRIGKKVLLMHYSDHMAGPDYVLALYDAGRDVFYTINAPFVNYTINAPFVNEDRQVYPVTDVDTCVGTIHCVMPDAFKIPMGEGKFDCCMLLSDVMKSIVDMGMFSENLEKELGNGSHRDNYLIITNNWELCISSKGNFVETGEQFTMCTPSSINGGTYHSHKSMPRDMIWGVVNLTDWHKRAEKCTANIYRLYDEFCKLDLENLRQKEITEMLRDCMEKYVRKGI